MSLENRIPPPLVFLTIAWLMRALARLGGPALLGPGPRWLLMLLCPLLGLYFAPKALLRFRRAGTTASPLRVEGASRLVTEGVYAFTRNPMYLSLVSLLVAWAAYLNTPWVWLGPPAFIAYITRFQIVPEERALLTLFGEEYVRYRQRVRRWI